MFAHRVGEGGAGLHVVLDGGDHLLEGRVGLLLAENLQTLHQWQAGIDHGRHLPGEDDEILAGDLGFEEFDIFEQILRFHLDGRVVDAHAFELRARARLVDGLDFPFAFFTKAVFSFPDVNRHVDTRGLWSVGGKPA